MSRKKYKEGATIFKDKAGDFRLRVVVSGRVTYSSTEGYRNRKDMIKTAVNSALIILKEFNHDKAIP